MNAHKGGGPAFPIPHTFCSGMTLRDWFAGQALAGLTSNFDVLKMVDAGTSDSAQGHRVIALTSFAYADAMLAARNKEATT